MPPTAAAVQGNTAPEAMPVAGLALRDDRKLVDKITMGGARLHP
jgi:hypothetical protein